MLDNHQVNSLTELVNMERFAADCTNREDIERFQEALRLAWKYYVERSNQFLCELQGITRDYPVSRDIIREARSRVKNDPNSNRSWNLAWLCLKKITDE